MSARLEGVGVGDTLITLRKAWSNGEPWWYPDEHKVVRVARKYLYVERYGREVGVNIETALEKTSKAYTGERYWTPEQRELHERSMAARDALLKLGVDVRRRSTSDGMGFTVESLEAALQILTEGQL